MTWGVPYAAGVFHDYWVNRLFPNEVRFRPIYVATPAKFLLGIVADYSICTLFHIGTVHGPLDKSNCPSPYFDFYDRLHVRPFHWVANWTP